MGYFIPSFLAFILNSCGVYIFHESSKAGCEPLVSSLIFLFAVFLLLWDLRLFPSSLRQLWKCGAITLHFFLVSFVMEHIMNDFWFPLETSLFAFLPKIAEFEANVLKQFGWNTPGILQFLTCDATHVLASYALSLFFLVAVFHATRIVDLRLLRCGPRIFFDDVNDRFKMATKKLRRMLRKRRVNNQYQVKFKEDEDDEEDDFCDGVPLEDKYSHRRHRSTRSRY